MTKKKHPSMWKSRLYLAIAIVVALVIGCLVGVITAPLTPEVCAQRVLRIGGPPQVAMYVCYGQVPSQPGGDHAL